MLMGSNHLQTSLFPSLKMFHLRLSGKLFSHRNLDRTQPHPACPSAPCSTSTRFSPQTTPHPTLPPQRAEGLNHHTKPGDRLDQPCIGLGWTLQWWTCNLLATGINNMQRDGFNSPKSNHHKSMNVNGSYFICWNSSALHKNDNFEQNINHQSSSPSGKKKHPIKNNIGYPPIHWRLIPYFKGV